MVFDIFAQKHLALSHGMFSSRCNQHSSWLKLSSYGNLLQVWGPQSTGPISFIVRTQRWLFFLNVINWWFSVQHLIYAEILHRSTQARAKRQISALTFRLVDAYENQSHYQFTSVRFTDHPRVCNLPKPSPRSIISDQVTYSTKSYLANMMRPCSG